MTRIVTTHYRYKRPPKRKQPVALEVAVVTIRDSKRRQASSRDDTAETTTTVVSAGDEAKPALPSAAEKQSAIVTIRRKSRFGDVPELAPEEVRRRADAADAMFQDFKRQIAEKLQERKS